MFCWSSFHKAEVPQCPAAYHCGWDHTQGLHEKWDRLVHKRKDLQGAAKTCSFFFLNKVFDFLECGDLTGKCLVP